MKNKALIVAISEFNTLTRSKAFLVGILMMPIFMAIAFGVQPGRERTGPLLLEPSCVSDASELDLEYRQSRDHEPPFPRCGDRSQPGEPVDEAGGRLGARTAPARRHRRDPRRGAGGQSPDGGHSGRDD